MNALRCALVLLAACAGSVAASGQSVDKQAAAGQPVPGLCAAHETSYFACRSARARWIGLCGTPGKALQYRFGAVGAVELQFPETPAQGFDQMLFAHYGRYQTDRVEVRFENQGSEYVIFDHREHGRRVAGVRVTAAGAKETEIACAGRVTSRLVELKSLLQCDAESALNGGACR